MKKATSPYIEANPTSKSKKAHISRALKVVSAAGDALLYGTVFCAPLLIAHAQNQPQNQPSKEILCQASHLRRTLNPVSHQGYRIYVGSAFSLDKMTNRAAWPFVAASVDGFYNHPVGWRSLNAEQKKQLVANFAHRKAIVEGDLSGKVADTAQERDTVVSEMQADGMTVEAMFENQVKPNVPQDTIAPHVLAVDAKEWADFCRETKEKSNADTYFMTAAFQLAGETTNRTLTWDSSAWDYMRSDIATADCTGCGLDSPVDNYLLGLPTRRQALWDMTHWAQEHGKKFLYLASPGDPKEHNNGTAFIQHLQQTVQSLEDNNAEPDAYAVESYIATGPNTVPEQNPDGSAASTITGGAYYLLKHRDGESGTLRLAFIPIAADIARAQAKAAPTSRCRVALTNSSKWLDYAPVITAHVVGHADTADTADTKDVHFLVGGVDVTSRVFGGGYLFYRKERLYPGSTQNIDVVVPRSKHLRSSLHLVLQVLPHSGSHVVDTLELYQKMM